MTPTNAELRNQTFKERSYYGSSSRFLGGLGTVATFTEASIDW